MRYVSLFVVAVSLSYLTPRGYAQSADFDATFNANVSARLLKIADLLERESGRGAELSTAGEKASPKEFAIEVQNKGKVSQFPLVLSDRLKRDLANGSVPGTYQAHAKTILMEGVKAKTSELAAYSQHLRQLDQTIATGSPAATTALLQSSFVPNDAAIVISGVALPSTAVGTAQPFNVSPQPQGGSVYEFVVGLGAATVDYPATAAILYRLTPTDPLIVGCTGALIAPNAVLTAGHCVSSDQLPAPSAVFFQHAGIHSVISSVVHPAFAFPVADIAILFLEQPVTGIRPLLLNTAARVAPGTQGRIIGYGYHSGLADVPGATPTVVQRAGMKYWGKITTGECDAEYAGKGLVCWTYIASTLEALAASTCHGDSGGPMIVSVSGDWVLSGVTSGGRTCLPGDKPFDTEVFDYASWISTTLQASGQVAAGVVSVTPALVPAVDNLKRFAMPAASRIFGPQDATWTKTFAVASGTKLLRVAMNTSGFGGTMHFSVGPSGDAAIFDTHTDDMAAACEVVDPKSGDWQISLSGIPSQEYQVVATTF